ncbi:hypothetical protein HWV62_1987 [Athelia sp. TMB]|nr:hypothetical protein HWV62_1987 [Athelia sp. TMB]
MFTGEQIRKFVLINYSGRLELQQYHGKAISLDAGDTHSPFPSIFIIHEMRVRGYHPFAPTDPLVPGNYPWQDWILTDGVFDDASGLFKRDSPSGNHNSGFLPLQTQHTTANAGGNADSGLALNENVIADILAATRAGASWKACVIEGTNWAGTTEDNIQKYVSSVDINE